MRHKFVLSCEHGGNEIPSIDQYLFKNQQALLSTHAAIDLGTARLYDDLVCQFDFGVKNELCRLLIEFNRSLHHPRLFSSYSKSMSAQRKAELVALYEAYRNQFISYIRQKTKGGDATIIHLSLHSFTPQLGHDVRDYDVGVLYNPALPFEKKWAYDLKWALSRRGLSVRMNRPYLGTADGFTTALRKMFPSDYVGIELELNQRWTKDNKFMKPFSGTVREGITAWMERR